MELSRVSWPLKIRLVLLGQRHKKKWMSYTRSTQNFKKFEIRYHENLRNIEGSKFTTSFSRYMPINCIRFKKYFKNCQIFLVFRAVSHGSRTQTKDVSETTAIRSFVGDRVATGRTWICIRQVELDNAVPCSSENLHTLYGRPCMPPWITCRQFKSGHSFLSRHFIVLFYPQTSHTKLLPLYDGPHCTLKVKKSTGKVHPRTGHEGPEKE